MKKTPLFLFAALFSVSSAWAQLTVTAGPIMYACPGTCGGALQAMASGGDGNYTYQWNNGATTPAIYNVCPGVYYVMVIDGQGVNGIYTVLMPEMPPINITADITASGCGQCNGSIVANVLGGTAPYVYNWSVGGTAPLIDGLCAGSYTLTVVDANGCSAMQTFTINDGFNVSIESNNANPCNGPSELTASVTNSNGPFTYEWTTGETTPSIVVNNTPVVGVTVSDGSCTASANIYLNTANAQPQTYLTSWLNRGFCSTLVVQLVNNSCMPYTGPFAMTLDSDINLQSVTPPATAMVGNTAEWANLNVAPGGSFTAYVVACVPLTLFCGDQVDIDLITSFGTNALTAPVLCSFDPNDKQVMPAGNGPEGFVPSGTELTYTVRFQNTGSIAATFIHVKDQLDSDLDPLSFRVITASHPMAVSIGPTNEVDFFFDNINLPDSTSNEPASHGFVVYAISPRPGLAQGTQITNEAHIYFDFNPPVITNSTLNTISELVDVQQAEASSMAIFPNPVTDLLQVQFAAPGGVAQLRVLDLTGRTLIVQSVPSAGRVTLSAQGLAKGGYVIQLIDGEGVCKSARFVKAE